MVRAAVLHLIKGKKLVGYHLHQKLREFQILEQTPKVLDNGEEAIIDCSRLFDNEKKLQIPMDVLCAKFLGFAFSKKKNLPHAFTEAKVAMALYKKWQQTNEPHNFQVSLPLEENANPNTLPAQIDDDEEDIELTGEELLVYIRDQVQICVKRQIGKALDICQDV